MRRAVTVALAMVVLSGCGSGDPAPRPTDAPEPTEPALAEGENATGALESFTCRADDEGVWSATGSLRNGEETSESYQIAVLVSDADAGNAKATTLEQVQPDESVTFEIAEIPPSGESPRCRATVVRLAR